MARSTEKLQRVPVAKDSTNKSKAINNDTEKFKLDPNVRHFPPHASYIIPADHEQFCNVEFSDQEREKAWKNITSTVETYSDEMVEQWNKEIDGLLTFVCRLTVS